MKNMAAKDNDGSVPKPEKGTIGLHEEKRISEKGISVSNADQGDLITKINFSQNCQLAVMGSTKTGPEGSAMSEDQLKKEDEGGKSNINFEEKLIVKTLEKNSRFQEEGPMGDDEGSLSEKVYPDNVSNFLLILFALDAEYVLFVDLIIVHIVL